MSMVVLEREMVCGGVNMCMCVFVCMCVYVCVCTHTGIHGGQRADHAHAQVQAPAATKVLSGMYICIHIHIYIHIYIRKYIHKHTHVYQTCISVYKYIYKHIHVYQTPAAVIVLSGEIYVRAQYTDRHIQVSVFKTKYDIVVLFKNENRT